VSEALRSSIYLDEATKKRAEELAQQERRSVSNLICTLIDQEYERRQHPRQLVDTSASYSSEET
jgi:predicted transcriptional regulator